MFTRKDKLTHKIHATRDKIETVEQDVWKELVQMHAIQVPRHIHFWYPLGKNH